LSILDTLLYFVAITLRHTYGEVAECTQSVMLIL
jgi:hypothetical protein